VMRQSNGSRTDSRELSDKSFSHGIMEYMRGAWMEHDWLYFTESTDQKTMKQSQLFSCSFGTSCGLRDRPACRLFASAFCVIGNYIVIVFAMGLVDVKFEVELWRRRSPEVLPSNVPTSCWSSTDLNEYLKHGFI
jgi:hypothetical protein